MSTGFNEDNANVRDFKHYTNPNNNFNHPGFNSASSMIPMSQVAEIQANLKCYNQKRGCKFFAKHHWCLCCMMLKAKGSEFFQYEDTLKVQDPDFVFSMTDWQRDEYIERRPYWVSWCNNYPRGATG